MIHPVIAPKWCGPTTIASLTGKTYEETLRRLASMKQMARKDLSGVWPDECLLALSEWGFANIEVPVFERYGETHTHGVTVTRFARERTFIEKAVPLMVETQGHLLAMFGNFMVCTATSGAVCPISGYPKPSRLVRRAWQILPRRTS